MRQLLDMLSSRLAGRYHDDETRSETDSDETDTDDDDFMVPAEAAAAPLPPSTLAPPPKKSGGALRGTPPDEEPLRVKHSELPHHSCQQVWETLSEAVRQLDSEEARGNTFRIVRLVEHTETTSCAIAGLVWAGAPDGGEPGAPLAARGTNADGLKSVVGLLVVNGECRMNVDNGVLVAQYKSMFDDFYQRTELLVQEVSRVQMFFARCKHSGGDQEGIADEALQAAGAKAAALEGSLAAEMAELAQRVANDKQAAAIATAATAATAAAAARAAEAEAEAEAQAHADAADAAEAGANTETGAASATAGGPAGAEEKLAGAATDAALAARNPSAEGRRSAEAILAVRKAANAAAKNKAEEFVARGVGGSLTDFADPVGTLVLVRRDGDCEPVFLGCVGVQPCDMGVRRPGALFITNLLVSPSHRGAGLGG
ncbi:hypothetical protein HYH02_010688 [Chlamydomonas schloesseri]|uniref:Uncharacterized protein n=1 Tax=Chlamydomonas schloesseri TaxID=2026947 RepID=A0A835T4P9_9CHLO|nr:hypothetical protein HYH02_010688 [Chlamydomonas schloesseri]|eukprot:KAG2438892.1 hypothetical protein HYH02_010688 [Chlamydomonas schloesseri]